MVPEIKEIRINGMNITETKLFNAMKKLGLNPEPQYLIDKMTVDFAFPEEKLVIEVNGPCHEDEDQQVTDRKRYYVLKDQGWKVKTFYADRTYYQPYNAAYHNKKLLEEIKGAEELPRTNSSECNDKTVIIGKIIFAVIAAVVLTMLIF